MNNMGATTTTNTMDTINADLLNQNIMKKFEINRVSKAIIMPRGLVKKASQYGSDEYNVLAFYQNEFPSFEIKIREPKAKKSGAKKDVIKGLTYAYMEKYLASKGTDEQKEIYNMLRNPSHDDGLIEKPRTYGEIKKWFLNEFPAVLDYQKKVAQILGRDLV